jgi:elongation factor Ts
LGENLDITTEQIKDLRQESGAGIMDCRNALKETNGDKAKALEYLQKQGFKKAEKTAGRTAKQGLVVSYIHGEGRIGALVEINCETDFVARTPDFQDLARNIAMQVTAMAPEYLSQKECPEGKVVDYASACLMQQPFIKDPTKTILDLITALISKTGENIVVSRFSRFELGK